MDTGASGVGSRIWCGLKLDTFGIRRYRKVFGNRRFTDCRLVSDKTCGFSEKPSDNDELLLWTFTENVAYKANKQFLSITDGHMKQNTEATRWVILIKSGDFGYTVRSSPDEKMQLLIWWNCGAFLMLLFLRREESFRSHSNKHFRLFKHQWTRSSYFASLALFRFTRTPHDNSKFYRIAEKAGQHMEC